VLAERRRGIELLSSDFARIPKLENKTAELIDLLLKYVDREVRFAVHSLSACRAFDETLYIKLGAAECHFLVSRANFEILTSFSFVWKEPQRGEKWYRIHDLLRRLDADRDNDITRTAHEVLEQHYRELENAAEAIYHANRLDWERGAKEWVAVFEEALRLSRYGECEPLLAVRGELWIKSDFGLGRISQVEGDYYAQLARYTEAKQEYLEAVGAYDRQLILTADDDTTLTNKGLVLGKLGELQAKLSEFDAAKQYYSEAIAALNSVLQLVPNCLMALSNIGMALESLGNLQAQHECEAAKQYYLEAIRVYNSALNSALLIAPDDIVALNNNKGVALLRLGDLHAQLEAQLSEFEAAKQYYSDAITALNSALQLAPNFLMALNDKGLALLRLGDLQAHREFEAAQHNYSEALTALNLALIIAPDSILALKYKGLALVGLGILQAAKLSEPQKAFKNLQEALEMWNRSLAIAPNDDSVRNMRDSLQEFLDNLGDDTATS